MILTLKRDYVGHDCCMGVLTVNGFTFQTIERPWLAITTSPGGAPEVSCVPIGSYELVLHDTAKHPQTWALVNHELDIYADPTPGKRSDILIHPANWADQLMGCIAPGTARMMNEWGHRMVTYSQLAFSELKKLVPWTTGHTLEISQ